MFDITEQDHEVVIIGMGSFSPLGSNCAEMRQALLDGRDSIGKVSRFDTRGFVGDMASSFDDTVPIDIEADARAWMDRATLLSVEAYREAIHPAQTELRNLDPERIGVCLGSSHSGLVRTEEVAQHVIRNQLERLDPKIIAATLVSHCTAIIKRMSGARGRVATISSACASSNSAVGIGADLIRRGELDLVIAGGSDTVSLSVMAGFNALRAISPYKTAPFSDPVGLNLGEGAGIVILKRADPDLYEGTPPLARILGYGLSGDAYHATAPDPDGRGCEQAMVAALEASGLTTADIDYINAHGTGTDANDAAESRSLYRLFGDTTPLSSTKSFLGHTLGASGVLEMIACLLLADAGVIPPGLRMDMVREGCERLDYVRNKPRHGACRTIMINNFGFGGNNSSLIVRVGRDHTARRCRPGRLDEVMVTGIGIMSATGAGAARFREALEIGDPLAHNDPETGINAARCPKPQSIDPALKRLMRGAPTTRYTITAMEEALGADKDIYRRNARSGLVGGMVFGAQKPTEKYMESVFDGDPAFANAHYFPMITMNATASACSLAFGITGYTTTLCGAAAGLAYAADLTRSDRQDRVAMVSGDELSARLLRIYQRAGIVRQGREGRYHRALALGEFAAAITLERASSATRRGVDAPARLAGWAHFQDPTDLAVARNGDSLQRAIDKACRMAGITVLEIGLVSLLDRGLAPTRRACRHALQARFGTALPRVIRPDAVFGYAPSCGAMVTLAAALLVSQPNGEARRYVLAAGYDLIGDGFAFILERRTP